MNQTIPNFLKNPLFQTPFFFKYRAIFVLEKPKEHKIVKAVQNQRADAMLSHLENRHKIGAKYFTENPNNIYCKSCDVFLAKNLTIMKEHLLMDAHMISSKVVIKKYRFNCDICGVYLSKEKKWMEHLISNAHKKRYGILHYLFTIMSSFYVCTFFSFCMDYIGLFLNLNLYITYVANNLRFRF